MLHRVVPWVWWFAWVFVTPTRHLRFRITTIGNWHLPEGGRLILPKHAYAFEIPWLGVELRSKGGGYAYFQMGSFVGYRLFGVLGPLFKALGGMPVMRPKEVRRLGKLPGWDREKALARMKEVNDRAEEMRRTVFRRGGALFVFPEGTRDTERVRPLISHLEVESALTVAREGLPVSVVPVVLSYGRKAWPRRRMIIDVRPAIPLAEQSPDAILEEVAAVYAGRWIPPDDVDAGRLPEDREPTPAGMKSP